MNKYNSQEAEDYLVKSNLLGIQSAESLQEVEAFVYSLRAAEVDRMEYSLNSFTLEDLKQLHYHLFQDIYNFAGEYRDVQLIKGATRFCQFQYIHTYAQDLFNGLCKESAWESVYEAADCLAYFKSELNMIHPFREGNGRTIRMFIKAFAFTKGFRWTYKIDNQSNYMDAMIQSVTNQEPLRLFFSETLQKI